MSEIKPVYQARMLFENMFCECDEEQYLKLKELNNCETRILYPAAALEALQAENAKLKEEVKLLDGMCTAINEKFAQSSEFNAAQARRIAELEDDLQFVERWANHHAAHPNISAKEALSVIQHYPSIGEITKSYKDGVIPNTRNPYAEIESQAKRIEEQLEAIEATANFARDFWQQADKDSGTRIMVPTFKELERKLRTYSPAQKGTE
jgi:hypothetical protein